MGKNMTISMLPIQGKNGQKSHFYKILWNPLDREIQSAHLGRDLAKFQPFPLKSSRNGDIALFRFLPLYGQKYEAFNFAHAGPKMVKNQISVKSS